VQDMVELIPSERDEAIYRAWEETGKGLRVLAREFHLSVAEIEQALDRCLPAFNAQTQLRAFKREIARLEDLSSEFFTIAKRDKDHDSAHLVARLNERIASMRGWTAINIRMDPLGAQAHEEPSSHEQIKNAILRIARPERFANNGNGPTLAPPTAPSGADAPVDRENPDAGSRTSDASPTRAAAPSLSNNQS
jgi:hypothetical protein